MYDFTFLVNGKALIQVTDSEFKVASNRAKKLFGYDITKFELQSVYERS